jgi:5,10-methylene-tetrahydrofolate dehydrogenase/methenyl tetrahydrofolate cyclohydrolase
MPRIYTEIRIEHDNEAEKQYFQSKIDKQAEKLGLSGRAHYVRAIVTLDAATEIIKRLKERK